MPNNSKLEYDIPYFTKQTKNLNFDDDDDEFGDSFLFSRPSLKLITVSTVPCSNLGDMHIEGRCVAHIKNLIKTVNKMQLFRVISIRLLWY